MSNLLERLPESLQWSEGMLLSPQHFQQNDIYWQQQLRHLMARLQPYYWGVIDIAVDSALLREGKVRLDGLHCVMPDGLVVQHEAATQDEVLYLDIAERDELKEQKPVRIHAAVPVRAEGAASQSSAIQRYASVAGDLAVDENTGESRVQVCRLRPRVTLFAGDNVPAKYISMPLFEVRRDIGGTFELTEYHPPLLRSAAAEFLGKYSLQRGMTALAAQIREKARELSGTVEPQGSDTGGMSQRFVLRHLASALPSLELVVQSQSAHPFDLYMALANVVGQLSGIADEPVPMKLEPYVHDNAVGGFLGAMRYVADIVKRLHVAYETLPFDRRSATVFERNLPVDGRAEKLLIELRPRPGQPAESMVQWLRQARIGATQLMPLLRQRRVAGAAVRQLQPQEAVELNIQVPGLLFELVNQAIEWEDKDVPVIQFGKPLRIESDDQNGAPGLVVMYRAKNGNNRSSGSGR